MMNDVGMLARRRLTALFPLLAKVLIVAGMMGLMFWMRWQLAVDRGSGVSTFLAALDYGWQADQGSGPKSNGGERARWQRRSRNRITAIRTVQALSLEENFARAFSSESEKASNRMSRQNGWPRPSSAHSTW